jgi:hypothetical protein
MVGMAGTLASVSGLALLNQLLMLFLEERRLEMLKARFLDDELSETVRELVGLLDMVDALRLYVVLFCSRPFSSSQ